MEPPPKHLDLERTHGLQVTWQDETTSFFTVDYLRRMSPSAESRALREELDKNPLAVLPTSQSGPLLAEKLELVGSYAVRIIFSDGHSTGIYTWSYLRELARELNS